MSVIPSLNATAQTQTLPASSTSKSAANDPTALQNQFLKLLTTQLNNQDPLNPMDNSQVTSQLAQISTVTGVGQLNASFSALQSSLLSSQMLQGASLIGQHVLVPGQSLSLAKGSAVGGVSLAGAADSVTVSITDAAGRPMRTLDLGAAKAGGTVSFGWDGKDSSGRALPDAQYTFSVKAQLGTTAVSATALNTQQVMAVTPGTNGVGLDTGTQTYGLADVKEIL